MTRKKKIILIVAGTLIAIFAIFATIVLIFAAMIFDQKPFEVKNTVPDAKAASSAILKLTGSIAGSADDDSDNPLSFLASMLKGGDTKVELSKDETNALITSGIASRRAMTQGKEALPNVDFADGRFFVEYSLPMKFSTPFGRYINIYAEITPKIADERLTVEVLKAKLGSLSLPASKITAIANAEIGKKDSDEEMQRMKKIVKKLDVKRESIEIVYDKTALMGMMLEKANLGNMMK